jgi:hypothetical protein
MVERMAALLAVSVLFIAGCDFRPRPFPTEDRADLKDVDIAVKNCVARLTGTVPSGAQRLEAAVVARSTVGVCSVQDDLQIAN